MLKKLDSEVGDGDFHHVNPKHGTSSRVLVNGALPQGVLLLRGALASAMGITGTRIVAATPTEGAAGISTDALSVNSMASVYQFMIVGTFCDRTFQKWDSVGKFVLVK